MFAFIFFTIIVGVIIYFASKHSGESRTESSASVPVVSNSSKSAEEEDCSELMIDAYSERHKMPPYMGNNDTTKCLANEDLMNKERDIVSRLYHFYQNNCFSPIFASEITNNFHDFTADDENQDIILVGDIIQCFQRMGIAVDVYSPHGMILTMVLYHISGNEDMCKTSFKFGLTKWGVLESAQNVCDECAGLYEMFKSYDPFVVSSILLNIDKDLRKEYINLMIELSECLTEIKDVNPAMSKSFIKCLEGLKTKDGSDIVDKERVASDSKSIELWGITDPVKDHEEVSKTWTCNVAGISRRCTKEDIGGIVGYVEAEPTNEFNPNAMAVYLHNGKHIGYIREDELDDYRYWSRCKKMPFVGYINEYEGHLSARIHIIVPKSREFLLKLAGNFFISTKEKGKLGLIPNVVDMIVPNRN